MSTRAVPASGSDKQKGRFNTLAQSNDRAGQVDPPRTLMSHSRHAAQPNRGPCDEPLAYHDNIGCATAD